MAFRLAARRFRAVLRRTVKRPVFPFLAHTCVKPRKSNVSGFFSPAVAGSSERTAPTRLGASCPPVTPDRTGPAVPVIAPGTARPPLGAQSPARSHRHSGPQSRHPPHLSSARLPPTDRRHNAGRCLLAAVTPPPLAAPPT